MNIELKKIKVRELVDGYSDNGENGVVGYGGKLNIRPPYQREFIYDTKARNAVISTLSKGLPLNTMYWVKNKDGSLEVLDGQQRSISICQFFNRDFSYEFIPGVQRYFNPNDTFFDEMLDYDLLVYVCEGSESEKLWWFRTINIAGEKLTDQELLNINYTGKWLSDAKSHFSKTNCPAYGIAKDYIKGVPIRQDFLEVALNWISKGNVSDYMSKHQNDANANELWSHFRNVIDFIKAVFPNYRKEMKSVGKDWGRLYDKYSMNQSSYDPAALEKRISELMSDEEVTDKKGVYEYVLSGESEDVARKLSKRSFSEKDKREAYERQNGICPICNGKFEYSEMDGDHIVPWWRGGKTIRENLQMVCRKCNNTKGGNMVSVLN